MFVLLFLHITTMIGAIIVSFGSGLVMALARRTGQVSAVRGVAAATQPVGRAIPILYVAGGLLGLLTAIAFGYNLLAPWLVIAYLGWLVLMAVGVAVNRTFAISLDVLLQRTPDGPLSSEIAQLFLEPRVRAATVIDYVVLVAILFDMVVKPFS